MKERVDIDDIKEKFNIIDKTEIDITDRGITSSMSELDKCKKYMEIKEIPENKRKDYLEKVSLIWKMICTAYNIRKIFTMGLEIV